MSLFSRLAKFAKKVVRKLAPVASIVAPFIPAIGPLAGTILGGLTSQVGTPGIAPPRCRNPSNHAGIGRRCNGRSPAETRQRTRCAGPQSRRRRQSSPPPDSPGCSPRRPWAAHDHSPFRAWPGADRPDRAKRNHAPPHWNDEDESNEHFCSTPGARSRRNRNRAGIDGAGRCRHRARHRFRSNARRWRRSGRQPLPVRPAPQQTGRRRWCEGNLLCPQ